MIFLRWKYMGWHLIAWVNIPSVKSVILDHYALYILEWPLLCNVQCDNFFFLHFPFCRGCFWVWVWVVWGKSRCIHPSTRTRWQGYQVDSLKIYSPAHSKALDVFDEVMAGTIFLIERYVPCDIYIMDWLTAYRQRIEGLCMHEPTHGQKHCQDLHPERLCVQKHRKNKSKVVLHKAVHDQKHHSDLHPWRYS